MVFPAQNLRVIDPGIGFSPPVAGTPVLTGIAKGGSQAVNTIGVIGALDQVRTVVGYGPLAELVALHLQQVGGPVYFVIHNSATSAALSAVALTPPGSGSPPAITVSGTPNDHYNLRVEILATGVLGAGHFRFALDAFDDNVAPPTWSQDRVIPVGGTYVIPNSGLTLTFPAGTYTDDHIYNLTNIKPQLPGTADLATVATLLQGNPALDFHLWGIAGAQTTSTAGSALAAAFAGHLTGLTNSFRYVRGFIDVGSNDTKANVLSDAASWVGSRVSPGYGMVIRPSVLAFEGFGNRRVAMSEGAFVRASGALISTDMARFADGADEGVIKVEFDGFYDQTLDAAGISTMRTWVGNPGFYFANAKLKSSFGSDFTDLQYGRVMDVACRTTYLAQLPYVADGFRADSAGRIDKRDAKKVEATVTQALSDNLLAPSNARGIPGHVSALTYTVDLNWNIVTTGQLKTSVAIRPLGYAKIINTDLFFSLNA